MSRYYKLVRKETFPTDMRTWATEFEDAKVRTIALNSIGDVKISTVFLGLNHQWGDGEPPLLFETMIFGGEHNEYQERYSTYEEAEAGHEKAVKLVEEGNKMISDKTERGFSVISFKDANDIDCSLQKSSSAMEDKIWFGCNAANPKILESGQGWVRYQIPDDVLFTTRMHLSRQQVKDLLPYLQKFVETGEIE